MKIVFVHTDLRLYWPARLLALKREVETFGWEFEVVEIAGAGSPYAFAGKSKEVGDYWHCLFPDSRIEDIPAMVAATNLYMLLDERSPDVVFAGGIPFTSGAIAVRWAKENGRRVIIFDDIRPQDVKRNFIVNWIKGRIYSNVDAMLIPAPSHTAGFVEWGVPKERLFFGVDVVDNDFFTSRAFEARKDDQITRQELQVPPRYLLGVGRQIARKNWARLLDAWSLYCTNCPESDLSLVLLGEGPERDLLESIVSDRALPNVHFHNFVQPDVLAKYYACAEGLVVPSCWESWGLVVNEAMAASLPILGSKECGCTETLVQDGINGWHFEPQLTDALVHVILELDNLPPTKKLQMGEASLRLINEWGLSRFCAGAIDAIRCVQELPEQKGGWLDQLILKLWKGRYRQS